MRSFHGQEYAIGGRVSLTLIKQFIIIILLWMGLGSVCLSQRDNACDRRHLGRRQKWNGWLCVCAISQTSGFLDQIIGQKTTNIEIDPMNMIAVSTNPIDCIPTSFHSIRFSLERTVSNEMPERNTRPKKCWTINFIPCTDRTVSSFIHRWRGNPCTQTNDPVRRISSLINVKIESHKTNAVLCSDA